MAPPPHSNAEAGSGIAFILTLDSSAKGGTPLGPPVARNDRTSLLAVAVKTMVINIQGTKPWEVLLTVAVDSDWLPRVTCHPSVVAPVKPVCCAAAH
jgi:hypothetical protein